MRAATLTSVLMVLAASAASGHAALPADPAWTHHLPGPNWISPDALPGGLTLSGGGASLLLSDAGTAWRLQVTGTGQIVARDRQTAAGLHMAHRVITAGQTPLLGYGFEVDFGVEFCALQRNDADLRLRWHWYSDLRQSCMIAVELRNGAVATVTRSDVLLLGAQGEVLWSLPLSELGGAAPVVQRLIETGVGKLLVVRQERVGSGFRSVLWTLDAQTGQPEHVAEFAQGAFYLRAVRTRSDQSVELLGGAGSGDVVLSRWSALGFPLGDVQLEAYGSNFSTAIAHPDGFVVIGENAVDTQEIRYYRDADLIWRAVHPAAQPYGFPKLAVSAAGEVASSAGATLYRFDSQGGALPVLALDVVNMAYAADHSLWVQSTEAPAQPRIRLSRYVAPSAAPLFAVDLRTPSRALEVAALASGNGTLHYLGRMNATQAQGTSGRLLAVEVDAAGQAQTRIDQPWTEPLQQAEQLADGWIVLSFLAQGEGQRLTAIANDGSIRWQRVVANGGTLSCNRTDLCVFDSGVQLQRFNIAQADLGTQDERFILLDGEHGQPLRGLTQTSAPYTTSLWDLEQSPASLLARQPGGALHMTHELGDALLLRSEDGLSLHAVDSTLWSISGVPFSSGVSTRHGRLRVFRPVGSAGLHELLRLDPLTGVVLGSTPLPADFSLQSQLHQARLPLLDHADNDLDWLAFNSADGASGLLALRVGAAPRRFASGRIHGYVALPGAAVVTLSEGAPAVDGSPRLLLSRIELDQQLLGDGFEAP